MHIEPNLSKDFDTASTVTSVKTDVIHEFLAFLAERLIYLNVEKHNKCGSFLNWLLDNEIGASIEDLKNRTRLQRYYQLDFKSFHKILKDNKNVLKDGYDPGSFLSTKHLKEGFEASINELKPILNEIAFANILIDQIVYRLYYLNEKEIKLIDEIVKIQPT